MAPSEPDCAMARSEARPPRIVQGHLAERLPRTKRRHPERELRVVSIMLRMGARTTGKGIPIQLIYKSGEIKRPKRRSTALS
jgi:hypothetical protein